MQSSVIMFLAIQHSATTTQRINSTYLFAQSTPFVCSMRCIMCRRCALLMRLNAIQQIYIAFIGFDSETPNEAWETFGFMQTVLIIRTKYELE